jgi:predicted RNA-binding Zn-ribbon protein involved in translation (DUF1610 family)
MSDNELAVGTFCESCGTRLDDKAGVHPCPICEDKQ